MNAPVRRRFTDTLASLISGLSGNKDKTQSLFYWVNELTKDQVEAMYRGDWIARKIITIPPYDALRQWRQWHAPQDVIAVIEEQERKFQFKRKLLSALIKARLYGGAAIIPGIANTGAPDTPLDLADVKKDSLQFLHVVSRHQLSNQDQLETDLLSPYFGQPRMWSRQVKNAPPIRIHPSRVFRFIGEPVPDEELNTDGWGDSSLLAIQDAIKQAGLVPQAMATTIEELKVDVIKVKEMTEQLGTPESTSLLTERLGYGMTMKSTLNSLVLDAEDDWQRLQLNLNGYPDVIQAYLMIAAAAGDIPTTRMLGQSPRGLNSTGESDTRNYYDRIRSDQEDRITPDIEPLDEIFLRSATGTRNEDYFYEWNELWQPTEAERIKAENDRATVVKMDVDMMLLPTDALTTARENQLIESGFYPGLEQALEESDGEVVNPKLEAQLQMTQMKGEQALAAQKAAELAPTQPPVGDAYATRYEALCALKPGQRIVKRFVTKDQAKDLLNGRR